MITINASFIDENEKKKNTVGWIMQNDVWVNNTWHNEQNSDKCNDEENKIACNKYHLHIFTIRKG